MHTSRFFARTASLCRTIKRCAPNTHLAVEHLGLGFSTRRITPANARAFLEELTCQVQQDVCVNFKTSPHFTERKLCRTRTSDAATWDALWKLEESCFEAEGSVGGYCFTYSRWRKGSGHLFRSSRKLEGCLAQLDWQALESSVKGTTARLLWFCMDRYLCGFLPWARVHHFANWPFQTVVGDRAIKQSNISGLLDPILGRSRAWRIVGSLHSSRKTLCIVSVPQPPRKVHISHLLCRSQTRGMHLEGNQQYETTKSWKWFMRNANSAYLSSQVRDVFHLHLRF